MTLSDKDVVLDILYQSDVKLTPQVLIKQTSDALGISSGKARKLITGLVRDRELAYQDLYGATYIDQSFLKPVRVTPHIVLTPFYSESSQEDSTVSVVIEPGISFGSGSHPTTRLCLEAIDRSFSQSLLSEHVHVMTGIDIGTGSGVLAIAACALGLSFCTAYEIDPVSVNEAKKNVDANAWAGKINVVDGLFSVPQHPVSMVIANLRVPTLCGLASDVAHSLEPGGVLILSGIREWEFEDLKRLYADFGMQPVWEKTQKQWSAVMMVSPSTPK